MQQNFTEFNDDATAIKTKQVNGLTLVWSEPDKRFMLPQPEPESAGTKILWDDDAATFIQITIANPSFVYRDRTATSPDGTQLRERIFIGRDKTGQTVELNDPEFQMALIQSKKLELQNSFLDMAKGWFAMLFIGVAVALVAFFWNLVTSVGVVAESFATGSTMAMESVGYWLAVGIGVLVGAFVLKYAVPALFRGSLSVFDVESDAAADAATQSPITNVNVTHIQGNGGSSTNAQDFINQRKI